MEDKQSQDKPGKSPLVLVVMVVGLRALEMVLMLGEVEAVVLGLETAVGFFLELLLVSVMPREIL